MPGVPTKARGTGTVEQQIPQPVPRDITLAEQWESEGITGCRRAAKLPRCSHAEHAALRMGASALCSLGKDTTAQGTLSRFWNRKARSVLLLV